MDLNLGAIGNGAISALITKEANIVWSCFPAFDSNPIFCRLLKKDEIGLFSVSLENLEHSTQKYIDNTAMLETILTDKHGSSISVTDFCPLINDTSDPQLCIVRIIKVLKGEPKIKISISPMSNYGEQAIKAENLNANVIRYKTPLSEELFLQSNRPINCNALPSTQTSSSNKEDLVFVFGNQQIDQSITEFAKKCSESTKAYWRDFSNLLNLGNIPGKYAAKVTRAAITLKLCQYRKTGAIVAAMTTSIPEYEGGGQNWDYRYNWTRDSQFAFKALLQLGDRKYSDRYLNFILSYCHSDSLQPIYRIDGGTDLEEKECTYLDGFNGNLPVRKGNAAYKQVQNDGYANLFFCLKTALKSTKSDKSQITSEMIQLAKKAASVWNEPEAGLWENRGIKQLYTYTGAKCWACLDAAKDLCEYTSDDYKKFDSTANVIKQTLMQNAWNESEQCFMATYKIGEENDSTLFDASVLLLGELGILRGEDDVEKFRLSVTKLNSVLSLKNESGLLMRHFEKNSDENPKNAFAICSFWNIEAFCFLGLKEEALTLFDRVMSYVNELGMFSEDLALSKDSSFPIEYWGNYPQVYSMAGVVNAALKLWQTDFTGLMTLYY